MLVGAGWRWERSKWWRDGGCIGAMPAGLLMALTYIGGELAQLMLSLPAATVQVFQGMLLFFLLAFDTLTRYRLRWGTKR